MSGTVGFRIASSWQRAPEELLAKFRGAGSAQVADSMFRFGGMDTGIKPIWKNEQIVGSAITVWARSADNLMYHKVLDVAQPGDIVIINTQGNITNSGFGELVANTAARCGVACVIVDGTVRDGESFQALNLPVYARGLNPSGCDKRGPGEIGYPVACGGVAVHSGDIVVADSDGITIVPLADAEVIAEKLATLKQRETNRIQEIADGILHRPEIDEILGKNGVL